MDVDLSVTYICAEVHPDKLWKGMVMHYDKADLQPSGNCKNAPDLWGYIFDPELGDWGTIQYYSGKIEGRALEANINPLIRNKTGFAAKAQWMIDPTAEKLHFKDGVGIRCGWGSRSLSADELRANTKLYQEKYPSSTKKFLNDYRAVPVYRGDGLEMKNPVSSQTTKVFRLYWMSANPELKKADTTPTLQEIADKRNAQPDPNPRFTHMRRVARQEPLDLPFMETDAPNLNDKDTLDAYQGLLTELGEENPSSDNAQDFLTAWGVKFETLDEAVKGETVNVDEELNANS